MNHVSTLSKKQIPACIVLLNFLVQHAYTVNPMGDSYTMEKQLMVPCGANTTKTLACLKRANEISLVMI